MYKDAYLIGSTWRGNKNPNDIDLVVESYDIFEQSNPDVKRVSDGLKFRKYAHHNKKLNVWQIDEPNLLYYVGMRRLSKGTLIHFKRIARLKGYTLDDNGITKNDVLITNSWTDIHKLLFGV